MNYLMKTKTARPVSRMVQRPWGVALRILCTMAMAPYRYSETFKTVATGEGFDGTNLISRLFLTPLGSQTRAKSGLVGR